MTKSPYQQPFHNPNKEVIHRMRVHKAIKGFVGIVQSRLQEEFPNSVISEAYAIKQIIIEHDEFKDYIEKNNFTIRS